MAALALGQGVFGLRISERQAKDVLRRKPRSPKNSGFFEEVGGNADMQRECYDELCSMEEYSEASDMTKQTKTDVEGGYDQLRFPCLGWLSKSSGVSDNTVIFGLHLFSAAAFSPMQLRWLPRGEHAAVRGRLGLG